MNLNRTITLKKSVPVKLLFIYLFIFSNFYLQAQTNLTKYHAMVLFDKSTYYPGEKLSAKIVLGKNDPNLKAKKVIINGVLLPKDKIKLGEVILDGFVGSVGDKEILGELYFEKGKSILKLPIKGAYSVIPKPNELIVSAEKMNVFYKGISNPLTISIPGVPSNKISASAPGLRKNRGSQYVMNPIGRESVKINVTGKLPNGVIVSSRKEFKIKDIPPAGGMVRGKYGTISLPKKSVANVVVCASVPDFLIDFKLKVSSFSIKVPRSLPVKVKGERMNEKAKKLIAKAKAGDYIVVYNIKANIVNNGYQIKRVFPIIIKLVN